MKEFIIGNIGNIGGVVLILIILTILKTNEYWHETKYEGIFVFILGFALICGAFFVGAEIAKWVIK